MTDYIEVVSDKIKQGKNVVFYTVGSCTFESLRELKHRFGLTPAAICDGDIKKQGRTYRGLDDSCVISPDEAISRFPDAEWFIPSLDYRYQIIGSLTDEKKIPPEKIINYTPVSKIKSCSFLQKSIIYDRTDCIRFCWRDVCPTVRMDSGFKSEQVLQLRNSLIEKMQNDEISANSTCAGCPQIREEYYPMTTASWSVNYFCKSVCNYKCIYCNVANSSAKEDGEGNRALGDIIGTLKTGGLLAGDYSVILSTAGEPLIHPNRADLYNAFDGFELVVNTNGSVYDSGLFRLMESKRILLQISVDAGTKDTFERVKGVDNFYNVKENITKYAQAPVGVVALKYLFVPDINDNPADIDRFIDLCMETDAIFVIISADYYSIDKISERTVSMMRRLKEGLTQRNILCVPYTAGETVEYSEKIREALG